MRRLLVFVVLVVGCFGQDLNNTKGELNGLAWGKMTSQEKIMLLSGMDCNHVVTVWALSDLPTCNARVYSKEKQWPKISNEDMAKELDGFYRSAVNVPLPISMAVVYTFMKLNGASKERLETFRTGVIQVYSK
jgi:hypothetical protein